MSAVLFTLWYKGELNSLERRSLGAIIIKLNYSNLTFVGFIESSVGMYWNKKILKKSRTGLFL